MQPVNINQQACNAAKQGEQEDEINWSCQCCHV